MLAKQPAFGRLFLVSSPSIAPKCGLSQNINGVIVRSDGNFFKQPRIKRPPNLLLKLNNSMHSLNYLSVFSLPNRFSTIRIFNIKGLCPLIVITLFYTLTNPSVSFAQCTLNSSGCGGYALSVKISPEAIVSSTNACSNGYNYNVRFSYAITVSGTNNCYNGLIGIQPQISCNSQPNSYFTINVPAPTVGSAYTSVTYTGVLTTTTNPYRPEADCATSTPASLNCNSLHLNVFGPGLSFIDVPCDAVALPIELADFNVQCTTGNVEVAWTTITETNNDFFTVERSEDAINWEIAQTINGAGKSSKTLRYTFTDPQAYGGTSYYRLKQTDFDGKFKYSAVAPVKKCTGNLIKGDVIVYPNPSTGTFNFLFNGDEEQVSSVDVFDVLGENVFHAEDYSTGIDLSNRPNGTYFVNFVLPSQTISKKVTIKK